MSRAEAIAQITPIFRRYGYEGATLSRLSQATGLGKASLYHYFPKGKEEMAAAVLEHTHQVFSEMVLKPLRTPAKPWERLEGMVQSLSQFYQQGEVSCLLAIFSAGAADDLFHPQVQRAVQDWIQALSEVLMAAGLSSEVADQNAQDAIIQIQGALVLVRLLNDRAPFERVLRGLPDRLLDPGG